MNKEFSILELEDKLGNKYYKATKHIPDLSSSNTMVFETREEAKDWLGMFS